MQKKIINLIIGVVVVAGIVFLVAQGSNKPTEAPSIDGQTMKIAAEKIEVIHFHATQQCWSCITVGEYALKTIKEKFPEEYASGAIVFRDIDAELPENRDLVVKYQARGSALFVNAITAGKDNIEEDVAVWRLVSNESQFISYFQDKLNKLLSK